MAGRSARHTGWILVALEVARQLPLVLGVDAGERDGQVVAQRGVGQVLLQHRLAALEHAAQGLAAVQDPEDELVALVAVLAHQRVQALHRRRLERVEAVLAVDAADHVEDELAAAHVARQEVARALGRGGVDLVGHGQLLVRNRGGNLPASRAGSE
ncbi:MAG: hypothetical protein QM765_45530 [Myxococcales bacterium]